MNPWTLYPNSTAVVPRAVALRHAAAWLPATQFPSIAIVAPTPSH
uniref:Uncharacterized protein n=1 Tax=Arundo donax TaxID=35708 RepID=A0A0A8ZK81_ARUDO